MSGNPFRRSQFGLPAAASAASSLPTQSSKTTWDASTLFSSPDTSDIEPNHLDKATKPKRVRIETPSPTSSPELSIKDPHNSHLNAVQPLGRPSSPPPPPSDDVPAPAISESFPTRFVDPVEFGADESELIQDEEVMRNTRRNSETGSVANEETTSASIANPFRRTLATIEGEEVSRQALASDPIRNMPATGESKPPMDVDSFKRMLLTGDPGGFDNKQDITATRTQSTQLRNDEAGPTKSMRRSIYLEELEVDSSTLSSETSPSSDDRDTIPTLDAAPKKKAKPPPPAPRTSKSAAPKGPQTVSFEDFTPTESSTTVKSGYKPLPKLPSNDLGQAPSHSNSRATSHAPSNGDSAIPQASSVSTLDRLDNRITNVQSSSSRARPPPPLARRSSEKRGTDVTRRRANSGLSEASDDLAFDQDWSLNQPSRSVKAPPPPPARRGGNSKSNSISQAPFSTETKASVGPQGVRSKPPSVSATSKPKEALARQVPSASSTSASAAPPPPARRRGSSKSSADLNTAVSYQAGDPQDTGHSTAGPPKNVLADLSAFQAEVDALRGQYRRPE